jgi:hypothetical protein
VTDDATAVNVSVDPLVISNSLSMSPFDTWFAGVPLVATTVAVPPVRVISNVLADACVELPSTLLIVEALVYVTELAALDENRYTSPADGPVPSNAFPFTIVLFLIP